MVTHPNRKAGLPTVYLWRATQSEPGCDVVIYAGTLTDTPPVHPEPVKAYPGLIYEESLFDTWELMGTTTGRLVEGVLPGEMLVENRNGSLWEIEQIIAGGHYRASR